MSSIIGQRYQVEAALGRGWSGDVWRVVDVGSRSASSEVLALKRFNTVPERLTAHLQPPGLEALIRLLDELTALKHPYLLSVHSYGIDNTSPQPAVYYTRTLLPAYTPITSTARTLPLRERVQLIAQVMHALAYLHRRGLLHRGLRPGNVCVAEKEARVMDFGLSSVAPNAGLDRLPMEVLAYLAPEQLNGAAASPQTDLYACGLLLYELVVGRFPYQRSTRRELIINIEMINPPLSADGAPAALMTLIGKLIDKNPANRPPSAAEALGELEAVVELSLPALSPHSRLPYLPTPRLFGRDIELAQIDSLISSAQQGRGGALFFSAGAGMGKTALLREAQRRAVLAGLSPLYLDVSGETTDSAWGLWRPLARCLLLAANAAPHERDTLRQMLGEGTPDVPPARSDTIAAVITGLLPSLAAQARALVLLLDDLHQASADSLSLLEQILPLVQDCALVIIGAFDAEAAPTLVLPATVTLRRLSVRYISNVSQQLFGSAGELPIVNALLHRETNGNPFFLMEVMRALVEQTGDLEQIGIKTLPNQLFAEGLTEALNRRLNLLEAPERELLATFALDSERIDPLLLDKLADTPTKRSWLLNAHEASILIADEGRWRFAHPYLHEAARKLFDATAREAAHLRLAAVLDEMNALPERIAYHFEQAERSKLAYPFAVRAAEVAFAGGAAAYAAAQLERLLPNADTQAAHVRLLLMLGEADLQLGEIERSESRLAAALRISTTAADRARSLLGLAAIARMRDDVRRAQYLLREALNTGHPPSQALALLGLSNLADEAGDLESALAYTEQALGSGALSALQHVRSLQAVGLTYADLNALPEAVERLAEAVVRAAEVDQREQARALNSLAGVYFVRGGYEAARACFIQRLALALEQRDLANAVRALGNLGRIAALTHQTAEAERLLTLGLRLAQHTQTVVTEAAIALNLGLHFLESSRPAEALTALDTAARAASASDNRALQSQVALYQLVAKVTLQEIRPDEALAALSSLVLPDADTEALVNYWRWKIDPEQTSAARQAAAYYAAVYPLTQDTELCQRYEELTNLRLPRPDLPPLPPSIVARPVDVEQLLGALTALLPPVDRLSSD